MRFSVSSASFLSALGLRSGSMAGWFTWKIYCSLLCLIDDSGDQTGHLPCYIVNIVRGSCHGGGQVSLAVGVDLGSRGPRPVGDPAGTEPRGSIMTRGGTRAGDVRVYSLGRGFHRLRKLGNADGWILSNLCFHQMLS
jgi:hypothetical protein